MRMTPKAALIQDRLGKPLEDWLLSAVGRGRSYRKIAAQIQEETGVVVSHETVRLWLDQLR
jgi:hypothetical protein